MSDDDLHARQEQAQIRILEILREFQQFDAFAILTGTCAAWLTRNVVSNEREHAVDLLQRDIKWWLAQPHEVLRDN